jgi:hypothetical protein
VRILQVDAKSGELLGGKDLTTGWSPVPQRSPGVVLSPTPSTSKKKPKIVGTHTHDPHRSGGLLNGYKP